MRPDQDEYWLFPKIEDWPAFAATVSLICATIKRALRPPPGGQKPVRLISCDEKTGIQALNRYRERTTDQQGAHLRVEHEYERHGTLTLLAGIDIASGQLTVARTGASRTEHDWLAFIEQQVSQLEPDEEVIFMMDQLNTHKSASLVRWVAGQIGCREELGVKGKSGILKSQASRMAFLERQNHSIRFLFTPKHCSWLNPIENWFARLSRAVLKGLSVASLVELEQRILNYVKYYNNCLAKAFNWQFDGFAEDRPLVHQRR